MDTPDASTVLDVLRRNSFCVIATAGPKGEPWLSPVFFNYSPDLTLVWESAYEARHSENIRLNASIAIFIKDTSTEAPANDVYIEATAREVPAERLAQALLTWWSGPHGHSDRARREVSDYAPSKPLRLYEAHIEHLYVLGETEVDGYRVDTRIELDVASVSEGATRQD
jgi:nitroimidazol reductase NimA-like FMN-containing flavoprotein (pyridoxamine 5'-phosphate oxidase superfamily)